MQSQYPVVEAVLIGTRAMVFVLCPLFSAGYYRRQANCARAQTAPAALPKRLRSNRLQLRQAVRRADVFPQLRPQRRLLAKKNIHDFRIELRPRAALDFVLRVLDRE